MKRILALVLVLILALSLMTACSGKDDNPSGGGSDVTTANNSGDPTPTDDSNDIDPTDDPPTTQENNNDGDTEGKLVAGKFSIEAPEGWEIDNNRGEAKNTSTGSFIALDNAAVNGTVEDTIDTLFQAKQLRNQEETKVNDYDAVKGTMITGVVGYFISDGDKIAIITVLSCPGKPADATALEAALKSFKIN